MQKSSDKDHSESGSLNQIITSINLDDNTSSIRRQFDRLVTSTDFSNIRNGIDLSHAEALLGKGIKTRLDQRMEAALSPDSSPLTEKDKQMDWIERQIACKTYSFLTWEHSQKEIEKFLEMLFGIHINSYVNSDDFVATVSKGIKTSLIKHGAINPNLSSETINSIKYYGCFINFDKFGYFYKLNDTFFALFIGGTSARFLGVLRLSDNTMFCMKECGNALNPWLLSRLISNFIEKSGIQNQPDSLSVQEQSTVLHVGGTENFAHHIWNNYGELIDFHDKNILDHVSGIEFIGSEFFGRIDHLFPFLQGKSIHYRDCRSVDSTYMTEKTIPVPVGSDHLNWQVCNYIEQAAGVNRSKKKGKSLLINIRSNDRECVNLLDNIIPLVEKLYASEVIDSVLVGGFASPVGRDFVTNRWRDHVDKMHSISESFRRRLPAKVSFTSLIEKNFLETIRSFESVALYLTPVGTAHHLIDWFHDCPGVVYMSDEFSNRKLEQIPGMKQRRFNSEVRLLFGPVINSRSNSVFDGRPNLSDFTLNPSQTMETVMSLQSHANTNTKCPELWTGIRYLEFLSLVHQTRKPTCYFEIGTAQGSSLALSNCKSIAVDPKFQFETPPMGNKPSLQLIQETSDDAFDMAKAGAIQIDHIDLAFLDGMHKAEYLLRDLFNTLQYASSDTLIFLHDCLPLNEEMAERQQLPYNPESAFPGWWTGDVWRVTPIIDSFFNGAVVKYLDCKPTGLVLITDIPDHLTGRSALKNMKKATDMLDTISAEPGWISSFYDNLEITATKQISDTASMKKFLEDLTYSHNIDLKQAIC